MNRTFYIIKDPSFNIGFGIKSGYLYKWQYDNAIKNLSLHWSTDKLEALSILDKKEAMYKMLAMRYSGWHKSKIKKVMMEI